MTTTPEGSQTPRRDSVTKVVELFGANPRSLFAAFLMVMVVSVAALLTMFVAVECARAGSQSTDGSIAFASDRKAADGGFNIYRMSAEGHGPMKKLTDVPGNDVMPAWSADGASIAFVRSGVTGAPNIYRMEADGSNVMPLTGDLMFNIEPAWFPSGRKLVFSRGEDIYTLALDASGEPAGKPTRLTKNSSADRQPVVSPDGRRIAFASDRDGDFDIYLMKSRPEGATNRPVKLTRNTAMDFAPDWSPGGERIAFAGGEQGAREIYVMKALPENGDSNPPKNLTSNAADDSDPAWSPEGEMIAFASDRSGDGEIWRIRADGTDPTNLTNSPNSEDLQPAWQP